jgi:predicted phage baseplate assembly protein
VPLNGGTNTVTVTQGVTHSLTEIGTSNGTAAQSFQIPQPDVIDNSTSVYTSSASGNVLWTQVQFLVDFGPDDKVYSVSVDQNQVTSVNFGDNINGQIPGNGVTVFATYRIGLGAAGNQPAGYVGVLVQDIPGVFVPFQSSTSPLYQSSAMAGGSDPETTDQIRANAPLSYSVQQRAVSLGDYEFLALNVPGVLTVNAIGVTDASVTLFILGPNYQPADSVLQQNVLNYMSTRVLAGTSVSIGTPSLIPVDVGSSGTHATLQVLPNFSRADVTSNVTTALEAILSPPNTSFGQLLQVSSLYAAVMSVPGVQYIVIPLFTREDVVQSNTNPIQMRQSEIAVAGSIFLTVSGGIA